VAVAKVLTRTSIQERLCRAQEKELLHLLKSKELVSSMRGLLAEVLSAV